MHLPGPESRLSRSRSRCRVTCEARKLRQGGGCRGGIQGNSDGDRSNNLQAQLVGHPEVPEGTRRRFLQG